MDFINSSVAIFTEQLASRAAVPGGGGASALAGAIGIALGNMVGELTVGKKQYVTVEEDIRVLMEQAQNLRVRLLQCVEKDAVMFEPLSRAYGIPKEDPTRDAIMEKCLRDAAAVPLEILDLCCECLTVLSGFAKKGSRLVLSDAAVGAALCRGALDGAAINVRVNTALMRDRAYADRINAHVDETLSTYRTIADAIYRELYTVISTE